MVLDFVTVPEYHIARVRGDYGLMWIIFEYIKVLFGGRFFQRFILCGALIGTGLGMLKLIQTTVSDLPPFVKVFAILLSLFNPFLYARMIDGQYNVFFGTMLFVWTVWALVSFLITTKKRYLALWIVLA